MMSAELDSLPDSIELPWFGEMPGYYNTHAGGYPQSPGMGPGYGNSYYPGGMPYGGMPMTQQGHSIVIQPSATGGPPMITQVPLSG